MSANDCDIAFRKSVPLMRVVSAALMDTYEDSGRYQQSYAHWAARGLKKLNRETLKTGKRKVTLLVNHSTGTATLPPDFDEEMFVGVINAQGCKIPLRLNSNLTDTKNIEEIECEDHCEKCNQDKQICQDLTVTEEVILVDVNGIMAQQTIIKKLYPDGSYYLETIIPIWDTTSNGIIYHTSKELITCIDLKPCGCIDETESNIEKIKCCNADVYACYFAPCDCECDGDFGGYQIFENTGLIAFDRSHQFDRVYLEYRGFMPKKNGQYHVPEVAFETLVEWTKYKSVQNKKNVADNVINRWFENYRRERENMKKIMGRISLSTIIDAIGLFPKFDLYSNPSDIICDPCYSTSNCSTIKSASIATTPSQAACPCPPATPLQVVSPVTGKVKTTFQLSVITGISPGPIAGTNTYQNDVLIGAIAEDLNFIIVNNNVESKQLLQFTFDSTTGTITRYQGDGVTPNLWSAGPPADVLIVSYEKLV